MFPIIHEEKSEHSGTVAIKWFFGKKSLDSENTTYSYGSLQEVLEFGIENIDLTQIDSILILGMGGGSIIHSLRKKFKYRGKIKAIEFDGKIIEIARREFDIVENEQLLIKKDDAYLYVQETPKKFDLIIIDLFVDAEVPDKFYTPFFWKNVMQRLKENGSILFNAGLHHSPKEELINLKHKFYSKLQFKKLKHSIYDNNLLLIRRRKIKLKKHIQQRRRKRLIPRFNPHLT